MSTGAVGQLAAIALGTEVAPSATARHRKTMAKGYRLERRQVVPRPLHEVFAFFADAGNLQQLTPPFLDFRILTPLPIAMAAGALIDYQLKLYGFPLRWRTRIELFEEDQRFVDRQLEGPYRSWQHHHTFTATAGGTEIVDRVEYSLPFGPFGRIAHALLVRRSLAKIFDFRHQTVARVLG